jgi:hypothetical protein
MLWRLRSLSPPRRALLVRAVLLLGLVRLGLWLVPSRVLLRHVEGIVRRSQGRPSQASIDEVVWSVQAASRRLRWATCLIQALAAQVLLARHGHPSALRIGVARQGNGGIKAHAWIEHDGRVLVGDIDLHEYTRLPDLRNAL